MALNPDGPSMIGRFIKKGSPLTNVVTISDFSLKEICKIAMTTTDNKQGNLILTKYHYDQELAQTVQGAGHIRKDLMNPMDRRPVLRPLDFTEDWKRQRQKGQGRSRRLDEEDELELELEYQKSKTGSSDAGLKGKKDKSSPAHDSVSPMAPTILGEDVNSAASGARIDASQSESGDSSESLYGPEFRNDFKSQKQSMDQVGQVINQVAADLADVGEELPSAKVDSLESFVPLATGNSDEAIERDAVETYRVQLAEKAVPEEERREILEEARARGFEEGFKQGEQKAALEFKSRFDDLGASFNKVINELSGMKIDVLENSQENFIAICKAMIESLLRKEFNINPRSFSDFISRAVSETVETDDFQIHINPETLAVVRDAMDKELLQKIVEDNKVEKDNFRIESKLTVVDGNLSKIVTDLLEQANINLYEPEDVDKVG